MFVKKKSQFPEIALYAFFFLTWLKIDEKQLQLGAFSPHIQKAISLK